MLRSFIHQWYIYWSTLWWQVYRGQWITYMWFIVYDSYISTRVLKTKFRRILNHPFVCSLFHQLVVCYITSRRSRIINGIYLYLFQVTLVNPTLYSVPRLFQRSFYTVDSIQIFLFFNRFDLVSFHKFFVPGHTCPQVSMWQVISSVFGSTDDSWTL